MLNSVVLVGRAGADPEIKYFESGRAKTKFNLAVDRPTKRVEGQDNTDWFRIELWGKPAEIATTVANGTPKGMPTFKGNMSAEQLAELAAYVHSLSNP